MHHRHASVRFASHWLFAWSLVPTFIGYVVSSEPAPVPMPPVGEGCLAVAPTPEMMGSYAIEMASDFTVSGVCCNAYSFTGLATGNNPTLTLTRGVTYTFTLTTGAAHPFAIRATAGGANIAGPFTAATFTFTPDFVMPANMVYQCSIHAPMLGNIVLVNPNSPPNATNLSAPETFTEETVLNLTDIVVTDSDNPNTTATLTLSLPAAGGLSLGVSGTVTSTYQAATGVWTASGPIANVNALLAGVNFIPSLNFSGNFSIGTSVTDGIAPAVTGTKPITGINVNDAPTLGNGALNAVLEDTGNPPGQAVSSMFAGQFSDVDPGSAFNGIAVLTNAANAATQGVWQYSTNAGSNWSNIGTVSAPAALVLSTATLVRFVPVANFSSAPTVLSVRGLDNTYAGGFSSNTGTESRVTISTASNGGTTAISSGVATLSTSITAVNDAPTLGNGALAAVGEDSANPPGQSVGTVFAGQYADVDVGSALIGVAVVGNAANVGTQGGWQYSSNAGTTWAAIGTVTDGATALALSTSTLVRFLPAANFNGAPTALVVRGLDNSYAGGFSATAGAETRVNVNTTTNGGSTPIAAVTANLSTSITPVNDPPVCNVPGPQTTDEDVPLAVNGISAIDVDGGILTLSVSVTGGTFTLGFLTGLSFTSGDGTADAFMAFSGSQASINTALSSALFNPTADQNGSSLITITVTNGIVPAPLGTIDVTVVPVNDPPTASNLNAAESFTQDTPLDLTDIAVSDVDDANLTVTLVLSNTAAGSLSTGTAGAVTSTYDGPSGTWQAAGNIADVNTLLAGVTFLPAPGFSASFSILTSVTDNTAPALTGSKAMTGTATAVSVAVRVFLEGAYSASTGLMNDAMRGAGILPTGEPFTGLGYAHSGGGGGEITSASVFAVTGSNAIVDWVLLELRDLTTPSIILSSRSALVQRDGDVVGMDGTSLVTFAVAAGSYHLAVRHRNHLGCMTGTAVALSAAPAAVDFTSAVSSTFGTGATKGVPGAFPAQVLWTGDVTFNGLVKYTGSANDRDPILVAVGSTTPNNVVSNAYSTRDVNLNGEVKYTGSGNDRDPILVNVGSTTPNNVRVQQLP